MNLIIADLLFSRFRVVDILFPKITDDFVYSRVLSNLKGSGQVDRRKTAKEINVSEKNLDNFHRLLK